MTYREIEAVVGAPRLHPQPPSLWQEGGMGMSASYPGDRELQSPEDGADPV
jgi:hypothetical protein